MNKSNAVWIGVALCAVFASAADAGECVYRGWDGDGCGAAKGSFLIAPYYGASSFYAFAAQSGQKWSKGAHPWDWNSPGIDYGVGPARGAVLADPATARLPTGCVYEPKGSPAHGPMVRCGPGAVDPTFTGFDFSLHGCVVFLADSRARGLVTLARSNFKNGPNCSFYVGYMIKIEGGNAGLLLLNDLIDEDYPRYTAPLAATVVVNTATSPLTVKYTAILNASQRPMGGTSSGPLDVENSVFVGFTLAASANQGQHGEVFEMGSTTFQAVYPSIVYRNNVVVIPSATRVVVTTPFYPNGWRAKEQVIDNFVADHNVVVTNLAGGASATVATGISGSVVGNVLTVNPGYAGAISVKSSIVRLPGGGRATILTRVDRTHYTLSGKTPPGEFSGGVTLRATTSAALAEMSDAAEYRQVTISNNVVDPTGAFSCIEDLGSPIKALVLTGNRSLVTGGKITGIGGKAAGASCPPLF